MHCTASTHTYRATDTVTPRLTHHTLARTHRRTPATAPHRATGHRQSTRGSVIGLAPPWLLPSPPGSETGSDQCDMRRQPNATCCETALQYLGGSTIDSRHSLELCESRQLRRVANEHEPRTVRWATHERVRAPSSQVPHYCSAPSSQVPPLLQRTQLSSAPLLQRTQLSSAPLLQRTQLSSAPTTAARQRS